MRTIPTTPPLKKREFVVTTVHENKSATATTLAAEPAHFSLTHPDLQETPIHERLLKVVFPATDPPSKEEAKKHHAHLIYTRVYHSGLLVQEAREGTIDYVMIHGSEVAGRCADC
jgi:hypothetical protein